MTQAVDAVAHDIAHGAGIVVGPHRFGAMLGFGAQKLLGDEIERVVPGNRRVLPRALGAGTAQRMLEASG